jgi:hypothetical protein
MKKRKHNFIIVVTCVTLICSNIFATTTRTCGSNHDSRTVSGSCGCGAEEMGTCGGAVVVTYNYICINTCGSGSCIPNGTQPGIVGYRYPCNELSCLSDPNICNNNYSSSGDPIPGDVLKCICS